MNLLLRENGGNKKMKNVLCLVLAVSIVFSLSILAYADKAAGEAALIKADDSELPTLPGRDDPENCHLPGLRQQTAASPNVNKRYPPLQVLRQNIPTGKIQRLHRRVVGGNAGQHPL